MEASVPFVYMNGSEVAKAKTSSSLNSSSPDPFEQLFAIDLDHSSKRPREMPRPTPDRVIHDWTLAILPLLMGFVLLILTVIALVYSIGVQAALPEGLAIAFAGVAYGLFGLWMAGHLVRYCRGHYTRGAVAEAVTPPPLPLTGIATGAEGTTMAESLVPRAAGTSVVLPSGYQQQQGRQNHQEHRQQQRQYTRQHQSRQNQQHHQQQCPQEPPSRPHVQSSSSPQGQFRQHPQPQREQQQQQRQQQRYYQPRDQPPPLPRQNAGRPHDARNTPLNQVPTILRPGPKHMQKPSDPKPRTDQGPSPLQRESSLQRTPAEAYTGYKSQSLDVQRPLHRENRQVSREYRAPSDDVAGPSERGRQPQGDQSRVTPHHGDVGRDPRRASIRSTSLDSGTRQSLQARNSNLPVINQFGSEWANPSHSAPLAVAPLRIQKGGHQQEAPHPEEPFYGVQHIQMSQQAGPSRPNLYGPRPQPQPQPQPQSDRRANGPQAIRMVSESPPSNSITATQPGPAEVRNHHLVPAPAPPPPSRRFEDMNLPGVQRTTLMSTILGAPADEVHKRVSREKTGASPATNFVLLPTSIFTHGQVVDPERGSARIFEVLVRDADDEKPWGHRGGPWYKHDSGIIVEDPDEAKRSSTPSSRWSSWCSRSEITSRSSRPE